MTTKQALGEMLIDGGEMRCRYLDHAHNPWLKHHGRVFDLDQCEYELMPKITYYRVCHRVGDPSNVRAFYSAVPFQDFVIWSAGNWVLIRDLEESTTS